MRKDEIEKIVKLIKRCDTYFYKYYLYKDGSYFKKYLKTSNRVKNKINKWKR